MARTLQNPDLEVSHPTTWDGFRGMGSPFGTLLAKSPGTATLAVVHTSTRVPRVLRCGVLELNSG